MGSSSGLIIIVVMTLFQRILAVQSNSLSNRTFDSSIKLTSSEVVVYLTSCQRLAIAKMLAGTRTRVDRRSGRPIGGVNDLG